MYILTCAPNEDSDQPAHPRSLIRVLVDRMKKLYILVYPKVRPVTMVIGLRECAGQAQMSEDTFSNIAV